MMRIAPLIVLGVISTVTTYAAEPWTGFRGQGGSIAIAKDLPITWEQRGRSGWTTRINGYGQSSPVVWGEAGLRHIRFR